MVFSGVKFVISFRSAANISKNILQKQVFSGIKCFLNKKKSTKNHSPPTLQVKWMFPLTCISHKVLTMHVEVGLIDLGYIL